MDCSWKGSSSQPRSHSHVLSSCDIPPCLVVNQDQESLIWCAFHSRFTLNGVATRWLSLQAWQLCAGRKISEWCKDVWVEHVLCHSFHNPAGKEMISWILTYLICTEGEQIREKVEASQVKCLLSVFSRLHAIISKCGSENLNCVRLLISLMSGFANSPLVNSFKTIRLSASRSGWLSAPNCCTSSAGQTYWSEGFGDKQDWFYVLYIKWWSFGFQMLLSATRGCLPVQPFLLSHDNQVQI